MCVCTSTQCCRVPLLLWPTRASSRPTRSRCSGTGKVRPLVSLGSFLSVRLSGHLLNTLTICTSFGACVCCVVRCAATAVLVMASTEVDKSGASYYGEQTLHYLAVSGETAAVQLRECDHHHHQHYSFYHLYHHHPHHLLVTPFNAPSSLSSPPSAPLS